MVEAAREGRSGALLVHGEAGMGKTTLLRDAAEPRQGPARAAGARDRVGVRAAVRGAVRAAVAAARPAREIPPVQAQALGGALALEATPVTDRFAVAAGVLSLLGAGGRAPAGAGDRRRPAVARRGLARGAAVRRPPPRRRGRRAAVRAARRRGRRRRRPGPRRAAPRGPRRGERAPPARPPRPTASRPP